MRKDLYMSESILAGRTQNIFRISLVIFAGNKQKSKYKHHEDTADKYFLWPLKFDIDD